MCSGKLEAPGGTSNSDAPSFSVPAWRPMRDRRQVKGGSSCSASHSGLKTFALMRRTVMLVAIASRASAGGAVAGHDRKREEDVVEAPRDLGDLAGPRPVAVQARDLVLKTLDLG